MKRSDSILRNAFFIFAAKFIDTAAAIAGFILVARMLGVTGLGRYAFVIAFVSIFGLVVNLGIDHIIIREAARRRERLPQIVGAAVLLKGCMLIIVTLLIIGGLFIFGFDLELKLAILFLFAAQLVLRELFTVISHAVFLALERLEYRMITTFAFQILRLAGMTVVLLLGYGLAPLFAVVIIADIVQAYWTMSIMRRRLVKPDLRAGWDEVSYLFRQSLPIGLAFGFTTAFFQLDILLLKWLRSDYENGLFSSAYRIVSTLILVAVPMIWVLLPHLTRTFNESREKMRSEGEFYLKFISGAMLSLAVVMGFYGSSLVTFAFGGEYAPAGIVLSIAAPTLLIRGVGYFFDLSLTAAEKQTMVAVGAGTAFFSKLALELILIPQYGYLGAAWGTLGAEAAALAVVYVLVRRYAAQYSLYRVLKGPVLAGSAALLLLWGLKPSPLAGIPLGMAVFAVLTVLSGTFNRQEREIINSLLRRKMDSALRLFRK